MKMDGGLVEHRRDVLSHINGKVIKKKKVKRRSLSAPAVATTSSSTTAKMRLKLREEYIPDPISFPLQQLYSFCKSLFKGPGFVPPPQHVHTLCNLLDSLRLENFGLSGDLPFFKPETCVKGNSTVIFYTTVYKCRDFSLVIFFLPAGAVIPLHNHPEMTVFSKLLLGQLHIKAYDWADSGDVESNKQPSSTRLATLKVNNIFTAPCKTSVLFPTTGGNIHEFTAITPCAVLDILGPPYSVEGDRDCSYYKEIISPTDEKLTELKDGEHSYGRLEEIEMPENLKMECIPYLGPDIIETSE